MSECDTFSISYDHVMWSQIFLVWNIPWVSNDISGLIVDRFNKQDLSNSIPLLVGFYLPISDAVEIIGCVWPRVSYVTS